MHRKYRDGSWAKCVWVALCCGALLTLIGCDGSLPAWEGDCDLAVPGCFPPATALTSLGACASGSGYNVADQSLILSLDGTDAAYILGAGADGLQVNGETCRVAGVKLKVSSVKRISIDGTAANEKVVIDLAGASLGSSILSSRGGIAVDLGSGTDTFAIRGGSGPDRFRMGYSAASGATYFEVSGDSVADVEVVAADVIRVSTGAGRDNVDGRGGVISATHFNTSVTSLAALAAAVTVYGGEGDDTLGGGDGNDTLYGGSGNDTFSAAAVADGDDSLLGEEGVDWVDYSSRAAAVTMAIGGSSNGVSGEADSFATDIENLRGGSGADTLTGSAQANAIYGGPGNDVIHVGTAGTCATDVDSLSGEAGDDTFNMGSASNCPDYTICGTGTDLVTYASRSSSVTVVLDAIANDGESAELDKVDSSCERIVGGSAADTLTGASGTQYLHGGSGADTLNGGLGDDTFVGGPGDDVQNGGAGDDVFIEGGTDAWISGSPARGTGADVINGGVSGTAQEFDRLDLSSRTGDLVITFCHSPGTLTGEPSISATECNDSDGEASEGDNVINVEQLIGGAGDDTLTGAAGADYLEGGAGDDTLAGGSGDDLLAGGSGTDVFDGGAGDGDVAGIESGESTSGIETAFTLSVSCVATTETCNGVDDDCDGSTDEGFSPATYYADADGDGYGDSGTTTTDCTTPSGYSANDDDCDDASALVSPAASETCDGTDNDCNGFKDDYCSSQGTIRWVATTGADSGACATEGAACATVAYAITQASDGDTIRVKPGTYTVTAPLDPGTKTLLFQGGGPRGSNMTRLVNGALIAIFDFTGTNSSIVEGFFIDSSHYGIVQTDGGADITIRRNVIESFYMAVIASAPSTIENNIIFSTEYGVYADVATGAVRNNTVVNTSYGLDGAVRTNNLVYAPIVYGYTTCGVGHEVTYSAVARAGITFGSGCTGESTNVSSGLAPTAAYRGTQTASPTTTELTDSTASWTTDQWKGYFVAANINGMPVPRFAPILSNTATTLTVSDRIADLSTWSVSGDHYMITEFAFGTNQSVYDTGTASGLPTTDIYGNLRSGKKDMGAVRCTGTGPHTSATTLYVEAIGGTDTYSGQDGCTTVGTACASGDYALQFAQSGDTIEFRSGTHTITKQLSPGNRNLTFSGQGLHGSSATRLRSTMYDYIFSVDSTGNTSVFQDMILDKTNGGGYGLIFAYNNSYDVSVVARRLIGACDVAHFQYGGTGGFENVIAIGHPTSSSYAFLGGDYGYARNCTAVNVANGFYGFARTNDLVYGADTGFLACSMSAPVTYSNASASTTDNFGTGCTGEVTNTTGSPSFASIVTGTSTDLAADVLTDNTKSWTDDQWIGYFVTPNSARGGFVRYFLVVANDATTLTVSDASGSMVADTAGTSGDAYAITAFEPTSAANVVDKGTSNALTTDIYGESRPVDGDSANGAECDIGAVEYQ